MQSLLKIWRGDVDVVAPDYLDPDLEAHLESTLGADAELRPVENVEPELTGLELDMKQMGIVLAKRQDRAATLEHLVASYTEQLRQTRVSIAAFEKALEVMQGDGF